MQFQKPKNSKSIGGFRKVFVNATTWVLLTCTLNHSSSLLASESHPNNLDKACEFITNPTFDSNKINDDGPNLILDRLGQKVAELKFQPSKINWNLKLNDRTQLNYKVDIILARKFS